MAGRGGPCGLAGRLRGHERLSDDVLWWLSGLCRRLSERLRLERLWRRVSERLRLERLWLQPTDLLSAGTCGDPDPLRACPGGLAAASGDPDAVRPGADADPPHL